MSDKFHDGQTVVRIDELNLDKECIQLPSDYLKFAHLAADIRAEVDAIKAELEVKHAITSKKVRLSPEKYGIDKPTEASIGAAVIRQTSYQELQTKFGEAKHRYDLAQAIVWALEHKKRSLTLLVELHGMGYHSGVKLSERGAKAAHEMLQGKVRCNRHYDDE